MKYYLKIFVIFSIFALAIPTVVLIKPKKSSDLTQNALCDYPEIKTVTLEIPENNATLELSLDEYLTGCVMAQISCDFEEETLKAQAIICRTCVYNELAREGKLSQVYTLQKYFTTEQAQDYYGDDFQKAYAKANQAVLDTDKVIITYDGVPVVTAFHPISCGFTESAEDIFGEKIPYLVSVESSQDKSLEGFEQTVEISKAELFSRLCAYFEIDLGDDFSLEIKSRTLHGTVKTLEFICDGIKKEIAGNEFCDIFGLNSCNLDIKISDKICQITCRGGGHLVGLSQYGANVLATQGKSAEDILKFYFSGVCVEKVR